MPRPTRYTFNNWLFSRLRLSYLLLAFVVLIAATWVADKLGWLPEPPPRQPVERRVGSGY